MIAGADIIIADFSFRNGKSILKFGTVQASKPSVSGKEKVSQLQNMGRHWFIAF